MGAPEVFLKSPSRGRSWESGKKGSQGKISFVTSILMPQPNSASESGIKSNATRQKYALFCIQGSDSEPIS